MSSDAFSLNTIEKKVFLFIFLYHRIISVVPELEITFQGFQDPDFPGLFNVILIIGYFSCQHITHLYV